MKNNFIKIILEGRFIDKRSILKFDDKGIPYQKPIEVGGIKTLTDALRERIKTDKNPIIVVGDMSGLGEFNNKYGREVADSAIEKALTLFGSELGDIGVAVSPSGDEMWLLPDEDVDTELIIDKIKEFLIQLNGIGLETPDGKVGLNAKFYVGRKNFANVEGILKYDEKGDKLPPGTIKVDKDLIGKSKDLVINDEEISDEKVIVLESDDFLWDSPLEDSLNKLELRQLSMIKTDIENWIDRRKVNGESVETLEKILSDVTEEIKSRS